MHPAWVQPRGEELLLVCWAWSRVFSMRCIRDKWESLISQIRAQRLREVRLWAQSWVWLHGSLQGRVWVRPNLTKGHSRW